MHQASNSAAYAQQAQQRLDDTARSTPVHIPHQHQPTGPHEDLDVSPSAANQAVDTITDYNARGAYRHTPISYELGRQRVRVDNDPVVVDEYVTLRIYGHPQDTAAVRKVLGSTPAAPERRVNTHAILTAACTAVRHDGGYRRSDNTSQSTPGQVVQFLNDTPGGQVRTRLAPSDDDLRTAHDIRSWIRFQPESSEYMRNLKTLAHDDYIAPRHAGLMASSVGAFRRFQANNPGGGRPSRHFGAVGEHVVVSARVERVQHVTHPDRIDPHYMLIFRTPDGDMVKWTASNATGVRDGDAVTVSGDVKDHTTFNGEAQTELHYCHIRIH